jgi:hypothetical protein
MVYRYIRTKRIIEIAMGVPLGFNKIIAESPKITKFPIEITHSLKLNIEPKTLTSLHKNGRNEANRLIHYLQRVSEMSK